MNIQSFSMPSSAYLVPDAYGALEGLNYVVWLVGYLFFDLKFMAMFSMMFGAGIVLMSRHKDAVGAPVAGVHYRRMALLLVFGLMHAYLIWYGDILTPYAVCGMVVFWVRQWPVRRLFVAGGLLIAFGAGFHGLTGVGAAVSPEMAEALNADMRPSEEALAAEVASYRGGWLEQLRDRAGQAAEFQLFVFPLMFFWRLCGLMLIGMALFKSGFMSAALPTSVYALTALVGGGLGLSLVGLGAYWNDAAGFAPTNIVGFGALPNWFGSVGVALMWMALVMLLCQADAFSRVKRVLSSYGRMAFTNYIGQSVLATFIFYGHGLGLFGKLDRVEQVGVVVAIWAAQLAFSVVWLKYFRFGPLEWVWRSGVYLKAQPMVRG